MLIAEVGGAATDREASDEAIATLPLALFTSEAVGAMVVLELALLAVDIAIVAH